MARLQCGAVTVCIDIKNGDRSQNGVGIQASPSIVNIDVGYHIFSVPEALEETENFRGLIAARASDAKIMSQLSSLGKSSVLVLDGEETGALCFFPKVEASLIPVLSYIRQVILDNWPDNSLCST